MLLAVFLAYDIAFVINYTGIVVIPRQQTAKELIERRTDASSNETPVLHTLPSLDFKLKKSGIFIQVLFSPKIQKCFVIICLFGTE